MQSFQLLIGVRGAASQSSSGRTIVRRAAYGVAVAALAAAVAPSSARAADTFWDGTVGDWNQPTNWSTDTVPTIVDNAIINNGGTARIVDTVPDVGDVRLGEGAGNSGTVAHTNGAAYVNEWMRVGIGGGTGTYNLSDTGSLTVRHAINIGEGGTGTLNMSGGTLTKLTPAAPTGDNGDQWFNIGRFAGGNGTFNLSGGSVQIDGPENVFLVARDGASGVVNHTGGTFNVDGEVNLGDFAPAVGPTGVYNISGGGSLTADVINVGSWNNGTGSLNVTGGTVRAENILQIGRPGDGGISRGTVTQSAGDVSANSVRLGVYGGEQGGTEGVYTMSGGTLTQPDVPDRENQGTWNHIGQAPTSTTGLARTGTFNLSGGTVSFDSRTHVGNATNSLGTVNQTGGEFEIRRHELIIGDTGTGNYNISGGSLRTLAADRDIVVGHWDNGTGTMTVSGTALVEPGRDLIVGNGNGDPGATSGIVNQTGGTVRVANNLQIAVRAADTTGTYNLSGGVLDLTGGNIQFGIGTGTFNQTGGELRNVGSMNRSFSQAGGVFRVGAADGSIGTSTINGNYTLAPGGTLLLDLAPDGTNDVLSVVETADLGGLLQLDLPGTDLIATGTEFTILTPGERIGQFSNSALVIGDNNQVFTISYTGGDGNDIVLTATNQVVPEPAVLSLLGLAAGASLMRRRVRRR